jgi:hypothetical protein
MVDRNVLVDYRNECLETVKSELDLMIRERVRQKYYFNGVQVCRDTFAFEHGIRRKTVDSIGRSLDHEGLGARVHGNKGKSPKHALTLEDVKKVKHFLLSYANKYGLPFNSWLAT